MVVPYDVVRKLLEAHAPVDDIDGSPIFKQVVVT